MVGPNVKSSNESMNEFIDAKFEAMVHEIEEKLRLYHSLVKHSPGRYTDELRLEDVKEICRMLRSTKLHFHKVLERYGSNYKGAAKNFVDLAYAVADIANNTGNADLIRSLRRHAEEIELANTEVLDNQL